MEAYRTIKRCQFDANCMMVTAATGAISTTTNTTKPQLCCFPIRQNGSEARAYIQSPIKALGGDCEFVAGDHANGDRFRIRRDICNLFQRRIIQHRIRWIGDKERGDY